MGRKPLPKEKRRSERACSMFTKREVEMIEDWMEKQAIQVTMSDAIRALVLTSLKS